MTMSKAKLAGGVAIASVASLALSVVPAQAATVSAPIAEGFAGPLGLAVGNDGTMYVAEAFGGQITALGKKGQRSVVATPEGDVAGVDATGKGTVTYTVTGFPETEESPPDTFVFRTNPSGKHTMLGSPSAYEFANNPDGDQTYGFVGLTPDCAAQVPPFVLPYQGILESNAYSVAIDGSSRIVGDAAGNSIIEIAANGRMSTVAVLPPVRQGPIDADTAAAFGLPDCVVGLDYLGEPVPTDVEVGPDGDYYVSSLPGAPELPGAGSVWRIDSRTHELTRVATGFSGAVDLAVAADGTIYVAELFGGQISRISNGSVSVLTELAEPGAVEIARDGTIYATTGVFGDGAVVKITP
jgi:hypothetical protein